MSLKVNLVSSDGSVISHVFAQKYKDKFQVGSSDEITIDPTEDDRYELQQKNKPHTDEYLKKFYFTEQMFEFIEGLMDRHFNKLESWLRLASNEGVAEPKDLKFKLDDGDKKFLQQYEGKETAGRLKFLYNAGEVLRSLDCQGMAAIVSQYIANIIDTESNPEIMGAWLDYPMLRRTYVKLALHTPEERARFAESLPTFDDAIRAARKKDPEFPFLMAYTAISDDPDAPVMGPGIPEDFEFTPEQVTKAISYFENKS